MRGIILTFIALVIHEAGHIAVSKLVRVPLAAFSVKPIGISMNFDFSRVSYFREAAVHLGGPVSGLLTGVAALALPDKAGLTFCGISVVLSVINLLPIKGFDGGGVLSCILCELFLPDTAEKTARCVSYVCLLFLWAAVLWIELRVGANLSLLAFVLFFILKVE